MTAPTPRRPHQRRDLALLAAGSGVSMGGDAAALIALLLELHRAGVGWVSAVLAAELVPFVVFAPLSGRLVDRVDNRRLLVAALAGQAALAVPLAFIRTPWLIVLVVFALTTVSTAVRPAVSAMVPALAGEERAASAYAWVSTGTGLGFIAGPAAGGVITAAAGIGPTLLIDAATFVVLAAACSLLSTSRGGTEEFVSPSESTAGAPRVRGGFGVIWSDPVLRWSIVVSAVAVACAVVDNVAAPFRFVDQLHAGDTGYGTYLAVWGAGALLGTQLPRRLDAAAMPMALAAGNALCGLGILGIGLAPSVALAFVASGLGGVGNGVENVALSVLVSSRVAADRRGRAFAASGSIIQAGNALGTASGAPLVAILGGGGAMAWAGGVSAAVSGATAALVGPVTRRRPPYRG